MCKIRVSIVDLVVLRVRTRRAGDLPQPEFLYQIFPPEALTLMATLPTGRFPVSIPYHSNSGTGYVITRSFPTGKKGFALVYALKRNRRYEAVKAIYQGREYGIDEFVNLASEWTGQQFGNLQRITGKYLYLAPTRDQWSVIRRDRGYMPVDPLHLSNTLSAELLQRRERPASSGVIMRIPFIDAAKQGTRPLAYFEQVELTFETQPDPSHRWMSFREYVHIKARESIPPETIRQYFAGWMDVLRKESGFVSWVFRSGKLFGACTEWWGDRNRRFAEHEGIDFAEGRDSNGLIRPIPEGTIVRVIDEGETIAILDDFLGKTVLVRHPHLANNHGSVLHTQYSHIVTDVRPALSVAKDQSIGRIGRLTGSKVPAHFHFAAAWVPENLPGSALTLSRLHPGYVPVTLVNFNSLIKRGI